MSDKNTTKLSSSSEDGPKQFDTISTTKTGKDSKIEGPQKGPGGPPASGPPEPKMIPMSQFFRYMNKRDRTLMIIGTISAVIAGFLLPCISLAMGAVTNTFDPKNGKEAILE